MEEQTLNELLNEVNEYVQESKDSDFLSLVILLLRMLQQVMRL